MKKLFSILILSLHLISSTQLREMVKLPLLFQHFKEHRFNDPKITFVKFLEDHYNDVPHTDNDEEKDNQLPFKTMSHHVLHFVALAPSRTLSLQKISHLLPKSYNGQYLGSAVPSAYNGKVWQPPKQMMTI